jgi:HK97 gp10 family phage protein
MPIEIEGLSQLSEKLTQLKQNAAKRYLLKAVQEGADVFKEAAEEDAPVYIGVLEESIVTKTSWSQGDGETTLDIDIGPTKQAFWGELQEFGTQDVHGVDKNGKPFHHTAQRPQRWLTNAFESNKDAALDKVATAMTGLLMDLENKE